MHLILDGEPAAPVTEWVYLARAECGCYVGAITYEKKAPAPMRAYVAKEVASWIRSGFLVELMPFESYRTSNIELLCTCQRPKQETLFP